MYRRRFSRKIKNNVRLTFVADSDYQRAALDALRGLIEEMKEAIIDLDRQGRNQGGNGNGHSLAEGRRHLFHVELRGPSSEITNAQWIETLDWLAALTGEAQASENRTSILLSLVEAARR